MVEISNVKVYELNECIHACRNAMRDSYEEVKYDNFNNAIISEEDLNRAILLCKSSSNSGHANFLTGIRVSFDIKYPNYFTPEFQRYHFADIVTSSSKMHKLSGHVKKESFNKYVDLRIIEIIQEFIINYENNPTYENKMKLLSNCPLGLEQFMRVSTNYMQLKNMYAQRKNHKLKEDWGNFCKMIEKLPFFEEFIKTN